jgi:hypothetical protein
MTPRSEAISQPNIVTCLPGAMFVTTATTLNRELNSSQEIAVRNARMQIIDVSHSSTHP